MHNGADQPPTNRRGFLKALSATAVGATALGAGAALMRGKPTTTVSSGPAVTVATRPPALPANPAVPVHGADLSQMASVQAENIRLKADLDAALRRIDSLEQIGNSSSDVAGALRSELDSANERIGVLGGLVALYEQLDAVDVGDMVEDGLESVGSAVDDLVDDIPLLADALTAGRSALDAFEDEIPGVEAGRRWLKNHVATVAVTYHALGTVVASAVDTVGSFFDLLAQWFADVTKWLPFGMGDKAAQVAAALSDLVYLTPDTIDGLQTQVHDPLLRWLGDDHEEAPLLNNVVRPVRDHALVSAENNLHKAQSVSTTFGSVNEPVRARLAQRRNVQQAIRDYRAQNGV